MPVNIPDTLPAIKLLEEENIFVMHQSRAQHQDIRPLRIAVLNLMPIKITAETDLIRLLSNTPLQIELDLIKLENHTPKNTPQSHMEAFYKSFEDIKDRKFDGMIVTGAPVEHLDFKDVTYWDEVQEILDWAKVKVTSSMFICWAAQAGLYHYYDIPKYLLDEKMFGVFEHKIIDAKQAIFRGFDDSYLVPHSRYTEVRKSDIDKCKSLKLLSYSEDSGVNMVASVDGKQFFITGHSEYSPFTLDQEYRRDLSRGIDVAIPKNYYKNNKPELGPHVMWRGHANLLFNNWLNYYVYQATPFELE